MSDKRIRYEMSECEQKIMEYLWEHEDGKGFSEIMEYLNRRFGKDWKKQTINTFIKRLTDKGLVTSQRNGNTNIYFSAMNRQKYQQGEAMSYLKEKYDGSIANFLTALTGGKVLEHNTVEKLSRLLEDEEQ